MPAGSELDFSETVLYLLFDGIIACQWFVGVAVVSFVDEEFENFKVCFFLLAFGVRTSCKYPINKDNAAIIMLTIVQSIRMLVSIAAKLKSLSVVAIEKYSHKLTLKTKY